MFDTDKAIGASRRPSLPRDTPVAAGYLSGATSAEGGAHQFTQAECVAQRTCQNANCGHHVVALLAVLVGACQLSAEDLPRSHPLLHYSASSVFDPELTFVTKSFAWQIAARSSRLE